MQEFNFDRQSLQGDWQLDYDVNPAILANGTSWGLEDVVIFVARPDFAVWNDYGHRQIGAPGNGDPWAAEASYWIHARSDDASGIVTLTAPSKLSILVPGGSWRGCGPGTVNVGARYLNLGTRRTVALFRGRLPLVDGVA